MLYDNERSENIIRLSFILKKKLFKSKTFELKRLEVLAIFKLKRFEVFNSSRRSIRKSIAIKAFVAIEVRAIVIRISKTLRVNILSSLAIKASILIIEARAIAVRLS